MLGSNGINIANFALGRQDAGKSRSAKRANRCIAISIIETDEPVPDSVISQLFEHKAVDFVRRVVFRNHQAHIAYER